MRNSDDIKRMLVATIWQSIDDATAQKIEKAWHKSEAIRFLTAERGEWAESRNIICDIIGCDPDRLRQKMTTLIALGDRPRRTTVQDWVAHVLNGKIY